MTTTTQDALRELYDDFARADMIPQWTQLDDLMTTSPRPAALPALWRGPASYPMSCEVDGDVVQKADTGDLVFDPAALVAYVSTIVTLVPGDQCRNLVRAP